MAKKKPPIARKRTTTKLSVLQPKIAEIMDLTKQVAPGGYTLSVVGADANGSPAPIGPASFTNESGSQSVSAIDQASASVSVSDTAPGVIRVDANDTPDGSGSLLTARLSINPAGASKAVSLTLTLQ